LHLQPGRGTTFFRLQLWQSLVAMIRDHPFLGVGLDNFLYLYQQRYILPTALAEANLSHPHNLILHFWLQLGLLGLAAALWLVGQAFVLAHRVYTHSADPLTRVLALGAAGSLVDFVVHGMIDNSYFLPDLAIIFWLTLGVLEGCRAASGLSANS
jgi:putative inorganic carbon (hco3(-)) transporter